jgi:tRNA(fMet)-specific endonuclease VapC
MARALLDTDTFSEIIKANNSNLMRKARAYRQQYGQYTISTVTLAEMVKGLQKRGREDRIHGLIARLTKEKLLPLDFDGAVFAGRIYGELEKAGRTIGRSDPMIAGIALANDLILVIGNTKHFERIVALGFPLRLSDWRQ